jgi:hypothetical protein
MLILLVKKFLIFYGIWSLIIVRISLFWDVRQCGLLVSYRRFGKTYWTDKLWRKLVTTSTYHSTLRNIQEEWTSQGEERDQQDATNLMFIHNLFVLTCFGHHYAHHQENQTVFCRLPETCWDKYIVNKHQISGFLLVSFFTLFSRCTVTWT